MPIRTEMGRATMVDVMLVEIETGLAVVDRPGPFREVNRRSCGSGRRIVWYRVL